MIWHLLYLLACAAMALSIPGDVFASAGGFLLIVGVVGLWRYSWGLVNFARAIFYIYWAYPRRKAAAEQVYAASPHRAHAFFLTTTFKIETAITTKVYRSIFLAASRSQGGATVVASVVDSADERLIRCLHAAAPAGVSPVKLIIDRIPGTGKRDALATSLRTIAGQCPTKRDIVLFVDGDSCVPEDVVARTAPFFAVEGTGALTTDEACEIPDNELFRDWYALRFTQRQMMMSAVALGHRVLTLTGRMSVVRADLATQPDFIASIEHDSIDHWRLGTVKFLTGDDKSTWFWLLKNGYRMAYLPDLQAVSMETQPKPGFVDSALTLMVRWFGNMLRTNGRALKLPPSKIGLFTWWSILDQRISMWTTLVGPTSAVATALLVEPMILPAYVAWVMLTRYLYCWLLATFGGPFPISYPFLVYFGQVFGALVKSYVLFRLDRQRWTRQHTALRGGAGWPARLRSLSSVYLHALAYSWLVVCILVLGGFNRAV